MYLLSSRLSTVISSCHVHRVATFMMLGRCHAVLSLECCLASVRLLCLCHVALAVSPLLPLSYSFAIALLLCAVTLLYRDYSALA